MIFTTITDEVTGANKSIGLFGKSLTELKGILSSVKTNGLFKTSIVSQTDLNCITKYNNLIKDGATHQYAMEQATRGASSATAQMIKNANGNTIALNQMTLGAKAASAAMKVLSIAGNMLLMWAISEVISLAVTAINDWIHADERAQEALEESVSKFEATTEEVNKLQEELTTCKDRLAELQKLADNGTISVADEKELEILKKQNDELERKIALKQHEQIEKQKEVIEDSGDIVDKKVASQFKTTKQKVGSKGSIYSSKDIYNETVAYVGVDEEIIAGVEQYNKLLQEQAKNPEKDYSSSLKNTSDRIEEMYDTISPVIEAYDKIIESGGKLTKEEQSRYEQLKKSQDAYLMYIYALEGTEKAYKALNVEQKRSIVLQNLLNKGLTPEQAQAVVGAFSEDDLNELWDVDTDFTPPQFKDYDSAEEYGRAYAQAWLNGIKSKTEGEEGNETDNLSGKSFKQIWNSLGTGDDETSKEVAEEKENLLELAEAGKLTEETFKDSSIADTFTKAGYSIEEATKKINKLVDSAKQLSSLKSAIGSIQDAYSQKKENGVVSADTLSSMESTFGSLGKIWTKYKQIAGSATSDTNALKNAQDELATAYVNSNNFLSGLVDETGKCTEANKQYYISQLNELGIKNAEEVVNNAIIQQKVDLALADENLADKTDEERIALINETMQLAGNDKELQNYILQKALANKTSLSTSESVKNLIALAEQCGATAEVISHLVALEGAQAQYESVLASGNADLQHALPGLQGTIDTETAWLNKNAKKGAKKIKTDTNGINVNPNKSGSSSKDSSKSTKQEFDWLSRYIDRLNSKISLLNAQKENLFTVRKKKNNLNDQIRETTKLINTYSTAYSKYMQKANSIKLSDNLKKKVRKGDITGSYKDLIKKYGEETAEAITTYQNWWDKAQESKQNKAQSVTQKRQLEEEKYQLFADRRSAKADLNDLKASDTSLSAKERNKYLKKEKNNLEKSYYWQIKIAKLNKDTTEQKRLQAELEQKLLELSKQQFDNIAQKYERQIQLIGYDITDLDNKIAEIEASGRNVNRSLYDSKKLLNDQTKAQYQSELNALNKKLADGSIKKGTDEYYDALDAIEACKDGISECVQTTYDLNNAINELHFEKFNDIADAINRMINEQDFLQSLFAHEKMVDEDTGVFSEAGLAKLDSLTTSYYAYKEKVANDEFEVKELQRMKDAGKLSSNILGITFNSLDDLEEKLNETYDTWQNDIKSTYDIESEIADMMKDNYQAQLDLLKELIDKKKEALNVEKDLHDYQKSITEKTDNISLLQKQISAYSGDTSQEGLAKVQQLQKELKEAKEDLQESEYEKYLQDQEDMLDKLYDEYEQLVNKKMDDFYSLVQEGINVANANSSLANEHLLAIAKKNGYIPQNDDVLKDGNKENVVRDAVEKMETTITKNSGTVNSTSYGHIYSPKNANDRLSGYNDRYSKEVKKKVESIFGSNAFYSKAPKGAKKSDYKTEINQYLFEKNGKVLSKYGLEMLRKILGVNNSGIKEALREISHNYGNIKNVGGFKTGGVAQLIKSQGEDGIALVRNGEGLIAPEHVPMLQNLLDITPQLNDLTQTLSNLPVVDRNIGTTNVGDISFNFELPNVRNSDDFLYAIQNDRKIQKALQSVTTDMLAGGGRLNVRTIK